MMTNGPNAKVGKILEVDLPRPRTRNQLLEHPDYYNLREELLTFLKEYEHSEKAPTGAGTNGVDTNENRDGLADEQSLAEPSEQKPSD